MGVPAFFRWLKRQYPLIISNCIEACDTNGYYSEQNIEPNPNTKGDREFDNLYLDMNGLIHPCFHPEGIPPPTSEAEVFDNIDRYVLRLFSIVRPRRVLFMAVDGTAPRAKMNQQRMRRFRAAKDAAYDRWKKYWKAQREGDSETAKLVSQPEYKILHDSNVITPGTPFMARLGDHLREFARKMQDQDPAWRQISIIVSDASVPGEGEHKIMDFVRSQRLEQCYDPNTRHVIYGLDADLIFLGLASHEVYFTIMRENVLETKEQPKKEGEEEKDPTQAPVVEKIGPKEFHFVSLWVMRQYLERDLRPDHMPPDLPFDLERAIDDFVFLCYACGNDFIPGLPGFSIYSGTVEEIVRLYRTKLPQYHAYLTMNGMVDFPRFIDFIKSVCDPRGRGDYYYEKRALLQMICPSRRSMDIEKAVNKKTQSPDPKFEDEPEEEEEEEEKKEMDAEARKKERRKQNEIVPRTIDGVLINQETDLQTIKKAYYKLKFNGASTEEDVKKIVFEYAKGMIWVLNYYLHGAHSWGWLYPYHSAPCSSDWGLLDVDWAHYNYPRGRPYLPLWQLISVLPPQSAHALPEPMQYFMLNEDSPIKDYYPTTFEVDLEGVTQAYKGHVHVPFIDEKRMDEVIRTSNLRLTPEEEKRNKFGETVIFMAPHTIINPQTNQPMLVGPPPLNSNNPQIIMQGPVWGQVVWTPQSDLETSSSHSYIYRMRNTLPPPGKEREMQNMSWINPKVQLPPWAIEKPRMDGDQEVFWESTMNDENVDFERRMMPLELPGVVPGQPFTYRERVLSRRPHYPPRQNY